MALTSLWERFKKTVTAPKDDVSAGDVPPDSPLSFELPQPYIQLILKKRANKISQKDGAILSNYLKKFFCFAWSGHVWVFFPDPKGVEGELRCYALDGRLDNSLACEGGANPRLFWLPIAHRDLGTLTLHLQMLTWEGPGTTPVISPLPRSYSEKSHPVVAVSVTDSLLAEAENDRELLRVDFSQGRLSLHYERKQCKTMSKSDTIRKLVSVFQGARISYEYWWETDYPPDALGQPVERSVARGWLREGKIPLLFSERIWKREAGQQSPEITEEITHQEPYTLSTPEDEAKCRFQAENLAFIMFEGEQGCEWWITDLSAKTVYRDVSEGTFSDEYPIRHPQMWSIECVPKEVEERMAERGSMVDFLELDYGTCWGLPFKIQVTTCVGPTPGLQIYADFVWGERRLRVNDSDEPVGVTPFAYALIDNTENYRLTGDSDHPGCYRLVCDRYHCSHGTWATLCEISVTKDSDEASWSIRDLGD